LGKIKLELIQGGIKYGKEKNDEIKDMSVNNIIKYTSEHPKEGARTSKILGKAAADCLGMYIEDKVESAKRYMTPTKQLETETEV